MIKIVKDTNPELRKKCAPVEDPTSPEIKSFLDEMLHYLHLSQDEEYRKRHPSCREGVGLAAPQAGKNIRALVISYTNGDDLVEYQLVNPIIKTNSVRKCYLSGGEGCLSVDQSHPGKVYRDFKIVVEAYDALKGSEVEITARGYDAIVLQHEIDHLDGILYYDRIDKNDPFKNIPGSVEI